jgi:hypothetical protein
MFSLLIVREGFNAAIIEAFRDGFPSNWVEVLNSNGAIPSADR